MNLLPSQTDQQFKVSRTLVIEIPAFVCKFSKTRFTGYFSKTLLLLMIILSAGIATPQESPGKRLNTWEIRFENALYLYLTNHLLDASNLFTRLIPNQREKQAAKALHYSILSLSALNQPTAVLQKLKIFRKKTEPRTLFEAAEMFYASEEYKTALEILKIAKRAQLSSEFMDRFHFLSAQTLVHLEPGKEEPVKHLSQIPEQSSLFYKARTLGARLLFRDREFESAISNLEELVKRIEENEETLKPKDETKENILLLLGKMYFENKEFKKSETIFRKSDLKSHRYESMTALFWVYFKTDQFTQAVQTLETVKKENERRFTQDGFLLHLAFSALYAREYQKAVSYFEKLTVQLERQRGVMEEILSEDDVSHPLSTAILKAFLQNDGFFPENPNPNVQGFKENRELVGSFEKKIVLSDLTDAASGVIRKNLDLTERYKMHYGPVDTFVANFDKRVDRLDSLYLKLKKEVASLDFRVGGTTHNKSYFKEWFDSNLSEFSRGKMNELTEFEKNIVQMFTHEIMYRQKVDSDFITKIVANKKSLENLHTLSRTKWPEKINQIISDNEMGLKELEQITIILNKLQDMQEEISALKREVTKKSIASIKKEAFRILTEQQILAADVKNSFARAKELLALQKNQKGVQGK